MKAQWGKYKDRPALMAETGMFRATFLPKDGGKLASLVHAGKELLAVKPGEIYKPLTYAGSYIEAECSGFDDMFPTVDPCCPQGIPYPDHGECCRIPYAGSIAGDTILLQAESSAFPIFYEKQIREGEGSSLEINYRIENRGDIPFPFLWAGHIMLQGDAGMKVLTPFDGQTPVQMMFAPEDADVHSLPKDRLTDDAPGQGAAYKFYYLEKMPEGKFGVAYPDGSALKFIVDPEKLPYLGIWLNNGAFQNLYSITPEPATTPLDAVDRGGYRSVILPRSHFEFSIQIMWEGC